MRGYMQLDEAQKCLRLISLSLRSWHVCYHLEVRHLAKMICNICQDVLRDQSPDHYSGLIIHHVSFASLKTSAQAACQLCHAFWDRFTVVDQKRLLDSDRPADENDDDSDETSDWEFDTDEVATVMNLQPQNGTGGMILAGISSNRDIGVQVFARPVWWRLRPVEGGDGEGERVMWILSHYF